MVQGVVGWAACEAHVTASLRDWPTLQPAGLAHATASAPVVLAHATASAPVVLAHATACGTGPRYSLRHWPILQPVVLAHTNKNNNKRPLTMKSMPPTNDEHAKLKVVSPNSKRKR